MTHKHHTPRLLFWRRVKSCPKCGWRGRDLARHMEERHQPPVEEPEPFDEFTGPMGPMRRADA